MSEPWPQVALSELLTKSGDWVSLRPEQTYRQVTVKLWGQGVALRNEATGAEIAASQRLRVRAGQFILSRIDARNGALGLVPMSLDGAVVSSDFPVFTPDASRVLPEFLGWLSRTEAFVELCKAASEGTTNRVRLKEDKFLAFPIALPPLEAQRRIVARIEALAAKIEEARRLRAQATEGVRGFIASLHVKMAGTRVRRLEQFLELYEDQEQVQIGRSYPQIGVKGFGQGLFERPPIEAEQTTYAAFNRLYAGAVVLSQVKGWEGAIAVCPSSLTGRFASPEYRTFRCISGEAEPEYLAPLFASPWFWSRLSDLTRGVGARRERVRPELFLRMEIPMPRIEDQRRALPLLDNLRRVAKCQAQSAAELDALLHSILERAFKGER